MSDFVAAWKTYIRRIVTRFDEALTETEARAPALIHASPPNLAALDNALRAVGMRLEALKDKVYTTWSDRAELVADQATRTAGQRRADGSVRYMHDMLQRMQVSLTAQMARALWPAVQVALSEKIMCTGCGAELARGAEPLVPVTAKCAHCGSVTQFVPDAILGTFYPRLVDTLALEQVLEEAMAIKPLYRRNQDRRMQHQRQTGTLPEPLPETVAELKQRERAYYERFLDAKAALMPMTQEARDSALDNYIARIPRLVANITLM